MKGESSVSESETFQEMLQRKLGTKRTYEQVESEDSQLMDDVAPFKSSKKDSRPSNKKDPTENKSSDKESNSGGVTEGTEMSEVNKSDAEDVGSPEDLQSSAVSGTDEFAQGTGSSLSKRLRMYKCERCNSQYVGLAMLRQHCKDVHGDQKYYKCHVCSKLFSHPSSRNIHLRLHSGEKPYKCSTCGKQFRVSSHLKDHVRVHTGERPYICDICHKGFKQSSDLKKHRRTHTLDKPYKCPICPSAFTRSHHCRGHINSVHKFFKCVACSALFTSEEAFERHKEFHPTVFPEQSDAQSTSSDAVTTSQNSVSSHIPGSSSNGSTQEDPEMDENNLKWDVANQLLELHKISQHVTSPIHSTQGSGSETASDSGDDVSSSVKPSPEATHGLPERSLPSVNVILGVAYQGPSLSSPSWLGQRSITPSGAVCLENGLHEGQQIQRNMMMFPITPQSIAQGVEYLKLPFPNMNYGEKKKCISSPERNGHGSVSPVPLSPSLSKSTSEQQKWSSMDQSNSSAVTSVHSAINNVPQYKSQFAVSINSANERRNVNFKEQNFGGENSEWGNAVMQKNALSNNSVGCHRVSVIQFHSSAEKTSKDTKNHEPLIKDKQDTSQDAYFKSVSFRLDNEPVVNQQQKQDLPQNHSLINKDYLTGIPQERIPYVPLNAESSITLQSWNRGVNDQFGKYSWALKEAKKTSERSKMREQAIQTMESKQFNTFPQAKVQQSTGMFDRSQVTSVDMLKFLAKEQIKQKDTERNSGEDSETSEASESGETSNGGQVYSDAAQDVSPVDSLEQKGSPENSIHHCQVCKKTFSRSSLLKQHSVIHMGNKRFKFRCEVCGKMFRTRSHLRDHTRIHTGERPFKCHICQKAFKQSSDLKKHINLHTGANQFKCEECNMEFRRADALRKHKLGHKMGNMPCGHCGKNFLHISALRQHRAMHNVQPVKTNRAFHRCNYCFKTFTKAESFKIHIEEHTREQSGAVMLFDCKICSMKFFTQAEFTDHMNIHDGKRPYKCFVCEKEFCIAEHLQDHVRLHTEATSRLRCEEGDGRFQGQGDLVRHSVIHA